MLVKKCHYKSRVLEVTLIIFKAGKFKKRNPLTAKIARFYAKKARDIPKHEVRNQKKLTLPASDF
jgi:hypothetical protein